MCKVQMFRALMEQRLNAAVEEICGLFERIVTEYEAELSRTKEEKERQREVLEAVLTPSAHKADIQQVSVESQEEVPSEHQEWSTSVWQEEPEPPHIKVEEEEVATNRDGEQLQGLDEADITEFPLTGVPVKSEDEDKAQSSQLQHSQSEENKGAEPLTQPMTTGAAGEHCGRPQADSHFAPLSDMDDMMSHSSETDHSDDTKEPVESNNNTHFICTECGKSFGKMKNLRRHMSTHIQRSDAEFSCPECGKMFPIKRNLNRHMMTHTGVRPYACSVCGNKFSRSHHLKRHMRLHTGEKLFPCSVCTKTFSHRYNLVTHMRTHNQQQSLPCLMCARGFSKKSHLERHIRTHTGEKPFSCTVCERRFTRKEHIKLHKCSGDKNST
ncbi:zinc finger and SCAN domain-containing protein 2-like [Dunckerocampus dactyliophorus]|uniref:zinc finger and SCAN domain-containing protein 2-like n=1 Tax=Dunckerocampus dactyliophorus TaxID=161453 RepID=UPI0024077057|nr:zinc finger and SCAN domain-containing protein 2-like [Dunckerocampus dactyliophorus]